MRRLLPFPPVPAWKRNLLVLCLLASLALGGAWLWNHLEYQRAEAALQQDQYAAGLRHLRSCLFLAPGSVANHLLAARLERFAGNFPKAESHLERAFQLQGGSSETLQLEWTLLRAHRGEAQDVVGGLQKCVDSGHPDSALILKTL